MRMIENAAYFLYVSGSHLRFSSQFYGTSSGRCLENTELVAYFCLVSGGQVVLAFAILLVMALCSLRN